MREFGGKDSCRPAVPADITPARLHKPSRPAVFWRGFTDPNALGLIRTNLQMGNRLRNEGGCDEHHCLRRLPAGTQTGVRLIF